MQAYRADLHVHTVLSPCAAVEMIPPLIVQSALENDIRLIAITDHNASANAQAVQQAARGSDLTVLPGMEVQTQEEVHVLCIFDDIEQLANWQNIVDQKLPRLENNPDYFGEQYIVNAVGDYLGNEPRLLLTSIQLSIEECSAQVQDLGGLVIPAHVNRQAFGLFTNLGFVPADAQVDALEISRHITPEKAHLAFPQIGDFPLVQNGDVHFIEDFLGSSTYWVEAPTVSEIRLALNQEMGRRIQIKSLSSIDNLSD